MDKRLEKLSNSIVNYSVNIKAGDRVLIQYESSVCKPLVKCLIKDIYNNKAIPFVKLLDDELNSLILENANSSVIDEMYNMKNKCIEQAKNFCEIDALNPLFKSLEE